MSDKKPHSPLPGTRIPAPANDQWDYLLSTIWNQMVHLVVSFDGCLDHRRLSRAALLLPDSHPVLAGRFLEEPQPCWEILPLPDPSALCPLVTVTDPEADLQRILCDRLDPAIGPQFRVTLLRGATDTLVLSVNHSVSDAFGVKHLAGDLASAYRALGSPRSFSLSCRSGEDRSLKNVLSLFPMEEQEKYFRDSGGVSADWEVPYSLHTCTSPRCLWDTLDCALYHRMKTYARNRGVTLNDLLLAAYFGACLDVIPHHEDQTYPVLTSIDLRRYLGPDPPAVANFSVAIEVRLPTLDAGSFPRLVDTVHREMKKKKDGHAGIGGAVEVEKKFSMGFPAVKASLADLVRKSREDRYPKNPFFSNTGILSTSCTDFGGPAASEAFIAPPVEYPPSFGIAVSTFREQITLSCGFCSNSVPEETVGKFFSRMRDLLSSLPPA